MGCAEGEGKSTATFMCVRVMSTRGAQHQVNRGGLDSVSVAGGAEGGSMSGAFRVCSCDEGLRKILFNEPEECEVESSACYEAKLLLFASDLHASWIQSRIASRNDLIMIEVCG